MALLQYEFMDAPTGSHNYDIGQLIKQIRYYSSKVSIDEFRAAIPQLKVMERQLQKFDADIGSETRNYIQEIMDELEKESEIETKLISEIQRFLKAICAAVYGLNVSIDNFSYDYKISQAVYWLEFYGYKDAKPAYEILSTVKEVFRSACYKYSVVFIDSSLTGK